MAFIEVDDLVKEYKLSVRKKGLWGAIQSLLIPEHSIKRAVDSIRFTIEQGQTVGFVGPNGAGKSTTVKMLTGILVPTSGKITIGGLSPYKDRKKNAARIGVVFGQRSQLWWDLPVVDTFDLLKHIYKIPDKQFRRNLDMFSDLLGLSEFMNQPVRQLSLGQKMKADIAAALLHDPEIIFFDEPTIGLDVIAKEAIRDFLRTVNRDKGTTMLFTTHDMTDIEKTCERMIIIDHGSIVYDGTVEEIRRMYGESRVLAVEFNESYPSIAVHGTEWIGQKGNKRLYRFNRLETPVSQLIQQLSQQYDIVDLTVQEPEIEAIIREIYQGGALVGQTLPDVG